MTISCAALRNFFHWCHAQHLIVLIGSARLSLVDTCSTCEASLDKFQQEFPGVVTEEQAETD